MARLPGRHASGFAPDLAWVEILSKSIKGPAEHRPDIGRTRFKDRRDGAIVEIRVVAEHDGRSRPGFESEQRSAEVEAGSHIDGARRRFVTGRIKGLRPADPPAAETR